MARGVSLKQHNRLVEQGLAYTPWSEIDGAVYTRELGGEFRFVVQVRFHDDGPPTVRTYLPHQCDGWNVTDDHLGTAQDCMRRFIKEARRASQLLDRLQLDIQE